MISELSCSNPLLHPVSVLVICAALVEGALTFTAKYARQNNLDAFKSNDYDKSPRSWSLPDLVKSAGMGGKHAVLCDRDKLLADRLVTTRQRIHAGRLLAENPSGPIPDLRPEEAVEAIQTANMVVRSVIDWINCQPKPAS